MYEYYICKIEPIIMYVCRTYNNIIFPQQSYFLSESRIHVLKLIMSKMTWQKNITVAKLSTILPRKTGSNDAKI
jgi:hypothetical protein